MTHPRQRFLARRLAPRWLLAITALLVIAGCTDVMGEEGTSHSGDAHDSTSMLPMTLTDWIFKAGGDPATGDPIGVAHLSLTPMAPGANDLTLTLTDLDGAPLKDATARSSVALTYRPLQDGSKDHDVKLTSDSGQAAAWRADKVDLPDRSWYAFHITLKTGDGATATATLYALLPDPSVHGADAVKLPASDPDAEAVYRKALESYSSWTAAQWRESLSSGADAIVVSRYSLTNRPSETAAQEMHSEYAAAFRDRSDGSRPAPPQHDFSARISIGDQVWSRAERDIWEAGNGFDVATFKDRAGIYEGATNIQLAGTEKVNGRDTQIVTFFLPERQGQSEAWFVWWVDRETGDPVRIMMVARMHFMIWDMYDINGSFRIEPPPADRVATPATGS